MDIRSSLTIALRKRGHGPPNIKIRSRRSPFNAEAVVVGISNCVGKGRANSKKDARTAALRDLADQLIRVKIIGAGEVPAMTGWSKERVAASTNKASAGGPTSASSMGQTAAPAANDEIVEIVDDSHANNDGEDGSRAELATKKGPYAVLESPPMNVGELNSSKLKQIINAFCRLVRQTKPVIRGTPKKSARTQGGFALECQMRVEALGGKIVKAEGHGLTKNVATNTCWINFVRELFSSGAVAEALSKQPSVIELSDEESGGGKRLPVVTVKKNPALEERLENYLLSQGVAVPALPEDLENASVQSPVVIYESAPIDESLFPRKSATVGGDGAAASRVDIKWGPPIASWDRWGAAPITEGPIAGQSLEEVSANMMGHEKANERLRMKSSYPICTHREKIVSAVEDHLVTMIKVPNGCGKSTQICQYLLEKHLLAGKGAEFNCLVVEPHRYTPMVLAQRVAEERREVPGNSVGYYVDYKGLTPRPYGAVVFVNAAVLLRQLEFGMQGISHIILDDVHERDTEMDLLLLLLKDLSTRVQPHLRLILTSASGVDTKVFEDYFSLGEQYATVEVKTDEKMVKNFFLEDVVQTLQFVPVAAKKRTPNAAGGEKEELEAAATATSTTMSEEMLAEINDTYGSRVKESIKLMSENEIDISLVEKLLEHIYSKQVKDSEKVGCLVLVPGWQNATSLKYSVERNVVISNTRLYTIMLLHSQLSEKERKKVFAKESDGKRRIVISVLGENSGSVPHVAFVIDCCKTQLRVSSTRQMPIYVSEWATKSQLLQRRNLIGPNTKEGTVYHLCARPRFARLRSTYEAEIKHAPLHEVVLPLKLLTGTSGSIAPLLSAAMDPAPIESIDEAEQFLQELGALDVDGGLTTLGEILARIECLHPRVGKALIQAISLGVGDLMCMLVAATAFYPPFIRKQYTKATTLYRAYSGKRVSEHIGLLKVNNKFRMVAALPDKRGSTEKLLELCADRSWDAAILAASAEAAEHLHLTMVNLLSLPRSFMPKSPSLSVARLDLLISTVVMAYYPNVCQVESSSQYKRTVQKLNASYPPDSQPTIRVPFDTSEIPTFTSPLFIFNEEISAREIVHLRRISMITPLQLLLFGSRKVTGVGKGVIELDHKIRLEMSPRMAGQIIALRESLETAIEEIYPPSRSIKPEMIIGKMEPSVKQEVEVFEQRPEELPGGIASKHNIELVELVKVLSSEAAWTDRVSTYTPPKPASGNQNESSSSAAAAKNSKRKSTSRDRNTNRASSIRTRNERLPARGEGNRYRQRDWSNGSTSGASKRQRRSPPRAVFPTGRRRSPAPYISRQPIHQAPTYQLDTSYHHRRHDGMAPAEQWNSLPVDSTTWSSLPNVLASAYGASVQNRTYELMQEEESRMGRIHREEQHRRLQLQAEQFHRHPMRRDDYAMGGASYMPINSVQAPLQQFMPSSSRAVYRTPGMIDAAAEASSSRYARGQFGQAASSYGLQQADIQSSLIDTLGAASVRRNGNQNPALPSMYAQQPSIQGYGHLQSRNTPMTSSMASMVNLINSGGPNAGAATRSAVAGHTLSNPLFRTTAPAESQYPYGGWR